MSASVAATRVGASKKTIVRGSAARARSVAPRSPGLRATKPSKVKRSVGSPDDRERRQHGARPGDRGHRDSRGRRRGDEAVARVAHRRHPGVAQHEHVLRAGELDELGGAILLVVVVERDEPGPIRDAERGQQALRGARVLGGDDRRLLERLDEAARGIPQVSDGGRREDDHGPSLDLAG